MALNLTLKMHFIFIVGNNIKCIFYNQRKFYVQKKQAQSLLLCYNDYQDSPDGQFLRLEVIV